MLVTAIEETYGDNLAQYRSEVALYGDAGPGQGLRLREQWAELVEAREILAALLDSDEGRALLAREAAEAIDGFFGEERPGFL